MQCDRESEEAPVRPYASEEVAGKDEGSEEAKEGACVESIPLRTESVGGTGILHGSMHVYI